MPAIAPLGVALLALQIIVGYGVYRYLTGAGRIGAAVCGVVAAVAGIAFVFTVDVVMTLAFNLVLLFTAALVGARAGRRPTTH